MNGSLVPANTKRSTLILGMFRLFPDVVIAASGTVGTILLLTILSNFTVPAWVLIVCLMPMLICALLVFPIPNYHNTLTVLIEIWEFLTTRQKFIWKGWCVLDEQDSKK